MYRPGNECISIHTQLQEAEKNGRNIQIRLPDGKATAKKANGCTSQKRMRGQVTGGWMKKQECQSLAYTNKHTPVIFLPRRRRRPHHHHHHQ